MRYISSSILALTLGIPAAARAQTPDTLSLAGRNVLAFGIGLTGARTATAGGGSATTHSAGQLASIAFTHFVRPQVAIEISTAILDAKTSAGRGQARNEATTPLLFGLRYAPPAVALTTSLRPFVSGAVGPYFRTVTQASALTGTGSATRSAMGARFGGGVNWNVARHFVLELEGDYHAVRPFPVESGAPNATGFAMSFALGFGWGGR